MRVLSPLRISAFALSTCQLLWGCATDAKHSWMPMSSQYSWKSLLLNWVPLSVMMRFGTPNLHTMDLRNATADFFSDVHHRGNLRPFCEFVNGDVEESVPADGPGERPQDIHAPYGEWPLGRDHLQSLSRCVYLLCMELACFAGPYQLSCILECCRPVEDMPKGLTNKCAR